VLLTISILCENQLWIKGERFSMDWGGDELSSFARLDFVELRARSADILVQFLQISKH